MGVLFVTIPKSFLPDEDQGVLFSQVVAPPGTPTEITEGVLAQVRDHFLKDEKDAVQSVFTVNGFSFGGRGQGSGLAFISLKGWGHARGKGDNSVVAITARANKYFSTIRAAVVVAFAPPAVLELGNATGFDFELVDRASLGHEALMQARGQLLQAAKKDPVIGLLRPNGLDDEPQYQLDIDWEKASALGLSIADISNTLGAGWGGSYVNQFIDRGRVKKVFIQGDAHTRMLPQDLDRWYVRNSANTMTPFSTFSTAHWTYGSPKLERYNGVSSLEFLGAPAPGKSTGDAMKAMEAAAATLPKGIGYEWTGLSYEERAVRLAGARPVRDFPGDRVPVPRGAVRELVDPGGGDAGRAARDHRHGAGDAAARLEQRCLLPGRAAHHGRPGRQERHPDRGVRQGKLRPGDAAARGHGGCRPPATAADPHDLAGLRVRRVAAGDRHRRRVPAAAPPSAPGSSAA